MDENYILKEGSPTSPMLDEHSTATIIEKTVDVSNIGEFVIGEENSSIITFKMNRYYDGVDLSEKAIKVMYRNTNGVYESDVVNIKYSINNLKFSWIVPNDATKTTKIVAYVCFISDNYLWKTKSFTITVSQSFDVADSEPTQNWFVNLESKLVKIEKVINDIGEIPEWAKQPEKPTYTYEEIGAEKAGASEGNLNKSINYTDGEVRKIKEDIIPEKIKEVQNQIPTKASDLENDLAVSYSVQELTSEQKQIARDNIDAGVSKKIITYDGASSSYTISISEGTVNDIESDSTEEFIEGYKTFYSAIQLTRLFPTLSWGQSKTLLKRLSDAHKAGVISDKLTYSTDMSFAKVAYSYAKNTNSEYYDSIFFVSSQSRIRLCYYPDKDEYSTSSGDNYMKNALIEYTGGTDSTDSYVSQFNMKSNPKSDMQVATKQYVDNKIMYVNITKETKDGKTVYKLDKTYEDIKEAIDSGKSPVVIYNSVFFNLDINFTGEGYIFTNSRLGVIGIGKKSDNNNNTMVMCYGIPPYISVTWSVNNMDINVQIENDELTNQPIDIDTYCSNCQLFGRIPAIKLHVEKTNGVDLRYDVVLYDTGNDFAGTTFINGNLTYCRLTMENMSDTSTWDYTETEIPNWKVYNNISTSIFDNFGVYDQVGVDKNNNLYVERPIKYFDTMDKISNQNTANGIASIAYSKGTSDIDISYPAMVYSTRIQSYGNFEGWIVDACGDHYACTIRNSRVTLGKKTVNGLPQPSKNDANKVLYGDMTWKDAPNATDEHINTLIDIKLGVIENGTY